MNEGRFRRGGSGYRPIRKARAALAGIKHAVLLDLSVRYKLALPNAAAVSSIAPSKPCNV